MYRSTQNLVAGLVAGGLALGSVAAFSIAAVEIYGRANVDHSAFLPPLTVESVQAVLHPEGVMPHIVKTVKIPGPAKVIYDHTVFLPTLTLESIQAVLHPEWWPPIYVAAGLNDKDAPVGWSPLPQTYVGWPTFTAEVPSEVRHD